MGEYRDVLGVDETATIKEIKAAYKKLAKEAHPDLNMDDQEGAEARMKKINEAYDGLKKGQEGPNVGAAPGNGNAGFYSHHGFGNINDIFEQHYSHFRQASTVIEQRVQIPLDILENGGDWTITFNIPDLTNLKQGRISTTRRTETIKIKPKTPIGTIIELNGSDPESEKWSPKIKLVVFPLIPRGFEVTPPNILMVAIEVDVFKMILGGKHKFELPWKKTINVTIPESTKAGQQIRLKNLGLNHIQAGRGDLIIHVVPKIPQLTDDDREKLSAVVEKLSK